MKDVNELEEHSGLEDWVIEFLRKVVLKREGKLPDAEGAGPEAPEEEQSASGEGDGPASDAPAPTPTRGAKELAAEVGLDLRLVTNPTGRPDAKGRPKATKRDVEKVLGMDSA